MDEKNFYKKCFLKLFEPIQHIKGKWIEEVAEQLKCNAEDNITYNCGEVLHRMANVMKLADWVFSDDPVEKLDD